MTRQVNEVARPTCIAGNADMIETIRRSVNARRHVAIRAVVDVRLLAAIRLRIGARVGRTVRLDLARVRGQHGVDPDGGSLDDRSHDRYDRRTGRRTDL
jgi:hypothetical protein